MYKREGPVSPKALKCAKKISVYNIKSIFTTTTVYKELVPPPIFFQMVIISMHLLPRMNVRDMISKLRDV